jgi:hypothetical protein
MRLSSTEAEAKYTGVKRGIDESCRKEGGWVT